MLVELCDVLVVCWTDAPSWMMESNEGGASAISSATVLVALKAPERQGRGWCDARKTKTSATSG